ncbi:MAG: hypothetical protein JWM95_4837 [Gemmatimonadetes bacterium]|nr:hypothetical protein [Gemmatimonadota bacterium]
MMTPTALLLVTLLQSAPAPHDTLLVKDLRARAVPMRLANGTLSGAGADSLLAEAKRSQFFLIGEDHGFADVPELGKALMPRLAAAGYQHLALEMGPVSAGLLARSMGRADMDDALSRMFREYPMAIPFASREELEFYGAAKALSPVESIWGLDQEFLFSPAVLLSRLAELAPQGKSAPVARTMADRAAHATREAISRHDPALLFILASADSDWARLDSAFAGTTVPEARDIIRELRASREIYLTSMSRGYQSGLMRSLLMKQHFMDYYRRAQARGKSYPKVVYRFGSNHVIQGASYTGHYDIGNLARELAASTGRTSFNVFVLVLNGTQNKYLPYVGNDADRTGAYDAGSSLEMDVSPFAGAVVDSTSWTYIDLRPLRGRVAAGRYGALERRLEKTLTGFDAVVVIPRARANRTF